MTKYRIHMFCDGHKMLVHRDTLPGLGETLRLGNGEYYTVTEVCHCLDESSEAGERVNIMAERIAGQLPKGE